MVCELLGLNEKWVDFQSWIVEQIDKIRHLGQAHHKCLQERDVVVNQLVVKSAVDLHQLPYYIGTEQDCQVASIVNILHENWDCLNQLLVYFIAVQSEEPRHVDQEDVRLHERVKVGQFVLLRVADELSQVA